MSTSIIIPKPNKVSYDFPKMFCPNQLGGLEQCSTTNAGIVLTYLICLYWVKGLQTSILAFNIT